MGIFYGDLVVKLVRDEEGGIWQLVAPLSFESDTGYLITAPIGSITNFLSTPRIPFVFEALGDRCVKSGTLHDYAYTSKCLPRDEADSLLKEMLIAEGMSNFEAMSCYLAVRLYGESHYGTR